MYVHPNKVRVIAFIAVVGGIPLLAFLRIVPFDPVTNAIMFGAVFGAYLGYKAFYEIKNKPDDRN